MKAYDALAGHYDAFCLDVPYDEFLAFYRALFARAGIEPKLVLDLACGTGEMTLRLAKAGYEVIGADISPEMLSVAASKPCPEGAVPPVYICQPMEALDLYGTIDAAVCCLDGVGYITDKAKLARAFSRVKLFLNPGGVFIFDINSARLLRSLDGAAFTRESEDAFCVYQGDYEEDSEIFTYTLDLFEKTGRLYRRTTEYHRERAYEAETLKQMLLDAGFYAVGIFADRALHAPAEEEERIFFLAKA